MTKENLKEYIELLKHQISISTSKQQIKQFKKLIKEAEKEKPKEVKAIELTSKVIHTITTEKQGDLITTVFFEDGSVWRYIEQKEKPKEVKAIELTSKVVQINKQLTN